MPPHIHLFALALPDSSFRTSGTLFLPESFFVHGFPTPRMHVDFAARTLMHRSSFFATTATVIDPRNLAWFSRRRGRFILGFNAFMALWGGVLWILSPCTLPSFCLHLNKTVIFCSMTSRIHTKICLILASSYSL